MCLAKTKLFTFLPLMLLCMGIFYSTAYACDTCTETQLAVNAVWVDGELLRINVADIDGNTSALAMHLTDYLHDAENQEYISVQAVDLMGNMSDVIRIRNPFFDPNAAPPDTTISSYRPPALAAIPDGSQQADTMRPLTPDGTGTVVDNVHDSDGIEFFTIGTEDGNVFYLIIDRQRNADNVYLLNATTEEDLISLAQAGGREVAPHGSNNNEIAIPMPPTHPGTPNEASQEPNDPSEPEPAEPAPKSAGNDNSMYLIIGIAVLAVGGAGYYFKIVRPKQNSGFDDEEEDNYGYEDESDDESYDEDGDDR